MSRGRCLVAIRPKNTVSGGKTFTTLSRLRSCSFTVPLLFPTAPRGTHLWEFIRDILLNPEMNPGLIKWEDRTEGVFRFLKSEAVAQLWGRKKNNSSMTYEKLSRAMR